MTKKLQAILLALGLSVVIFGVGCSNDDDEEPTGPTMVERLTGVWFAAPAGTVGDSVMTTFNGSGTFAIIEYVNIAGPLDELIITTSTGTFGADANSIQLHVTMQDGDPVNLNWDWTHTLTAADDSLHLTHDYGIGAPATVHYGYVAPPAN